MALRLEGWPLFWYSVALVVFILILAYGIAGWYERRARRRREARMRSRG